jgi:hypothetical protein
MPRAKKNADWALQGPLKEEVLRRWLELDSFNRTVALQRINETYRLLTSLRMPFLYIGRGGFQRPVPGDICEAHDIVVWLLIKMAEATCSSTRTSKESGSSRPARTKGGSSAKSS